MQFLKRITSSFILLPITFFLIYKGSFIFNVFILIVFLINIFEWYKMSNNKNYNFIGYIFLPISFYATYLIRNNHDNDSIFIFFL